MADEGDKYAWSPLPELPSARDIAKVYDFGPFVRSSAGTKDPAVFSQELNKLPSQARRTWMQVIRLDGTTRVGNSAARRLLAEFSKTGTSLLRALDNSGGGAVFSRETPQFWHRLLHLQDPVQPRGERSDSVLETLRILDLHGAEGDDFLGWIALVDGVRRGLPGGSILALALLGDLDEGAARAYQELARRFSGVPRERPTRDQVYPMVKRALEPTVEIEAAEVLATSTHDLAVQEASDETGHQVMSPESQSEQPDEQPLREVLVPRGISELLVDAKALIVRAAEVAAGLREAADLVKLGQIPAAADRLAHDLTDWIDKTQVLLPKGGNLIDFAADLEQQVRKADEALKELKDLRNGFSILHSAGLEAPANDLLRSKGYESLADLDLAIDVAIGAELPTSGSERQPELSDGPGAEAGWTRPALEPERNGPGEPQEPASGESVIDDNEGDIERGALVQPRQDEPAATEESAPGDEVKFAPEAKADGDGQFIAASGAGDVPDTPAAEVQDVVEDVVEDVVGDDTGTGTGNLQSTGDLWASGVVARLISEGRERLAAVAADSSGVSEARRRSLLLFAGAFSIDAESLLPQLADLSLDEASEGELNADDMRLLLAGRARLALQLGYSPMGSLDDIRARAMLDDHPVGELASVVASLAVRGFKRPAAIASGGALPGDWDSLASEAANLRERLANSHLSFHRAQRIVRYLARDNQPLGEALNDLVSLAEAHARGESPDASAWASIEALGQTLRDREKADRLLSSADEAVSIPQQLRQEIVSHARRGMVAALDEVADLIDRATTLRGRARSSEAETNSDDLRELQAALHRTAAFAPSSVGDAALRRLVDWLHSDTPETLPSTSIRDAIVRELDPLFEIPRDDAGLPSRAPTEAEFLTLLEGRSSTAVIKGYLDAGNQSAADAYLQVSGAQLTDAEDDEVLRSRRALAGRLSAAITSVERTVAKLGSLTADDEVRNFSVRVSQHRAPEDGRYDIALNQIRKIEDEAGERLGTIRDRLRSRAEKIANGPDRERILRLLDVGDEPLAVEFLTSAESGRPLPTIDAPSGDDFGAFYPALVDEADRAAKRGEKNVVQFIRQRLGASEDPANRMLSQGLHAWTRLKADKQGRGHEATIARIAALVRMLGLIPDSQSWIKELSRIRRAGYATWLVKARPIDRSYVPNFGTQAHGAYDITLAWDEASPQRLLQMIDERRRTQPNIIIYFGTLSADQRRELRRISVRDSSGFAPIVVDETVIAWLSAHEEPGWRLTQRVTLPFTTINPYSPFAGGEVPDEVFVGRKAEQEQIVLPTGSMFVYGGRQLGKSALLRKVERGFQSQRQETTTDGIDHSPVAVYIDLKSHGIGESAKPSALWQTLGRRLAQEAVLPEGPEWDADTVTSGIADWLDGDPARRLLLLLDEADNFLTIDSRDMGESGMGGFPTLQRLKGLMENSGRRFKPVFAGLHQVQRFHSLPNTPVVHGGQDILIGPLQPVDARELVRDPLFALGYEFESDETLWRLLLLTNYQASLIQIICEALVRHMRANEQLPKIGGRIVITNRHVDEVYSNPEVRQRIEERFRWTINLDSRYRVIALVTALLSMDGEPGQTFRATDIHDLCAMYWPAGFAQTTLSSREFLRYLDEMKGLGVLHRQGSTGAEEFGLRSPSIIELLGSKQSIEAELVDAQNSLEADPQYNQTMNRRILELDPAGAAKRSPLSDADLATLLDHAAGTSKVQVVVGTSALGIERVARALERGAEDGPHPLEFQVVTQSGRLRGLLGAGDKAHLGVDLSALSISSAQRDEAIALLVENPGVYATLILRADGQSDLPALPNDWPVTQLRRWSTAGLRSWQDSPFAVPAMRERLREVTGGWPEFVEFTMHEITYGASRDAALEAAASRVREPDAARRFLDKVGIPIATAAKWADLEDLPLNSELLRELFGDYAHTVVDRLLRLDVLDETPDGWVLDRLIMEAVSALTS